MPTSTETENFFNTNKDFQAVLAGQVSTYDFFTKDKYAESKNAFMNQYKNTFGVRHDSLYTDENVAAAWIAKLRYNQEMTDEQFIGFITRSEKIFSGSEEKLNLSTKETDQNDLCAIMWGIEALNGIQSFDAGATRVRLPNGVAPKIIATLEDSGSVPRESTHATGTKLVDKALGKDIEEEQLRKFTPRGTGAILVIPTSRNGKGAVAKASKEKVSNDITEKDYDLLLKRENYGYNDTSIHSRVHSKVGFINYLTEHSAKYKEGMALIHSKSALAKIAEKKWGKGEKVHRKEHLSELKNQSSVLVNLLEAGQKVGWFTDFKTKWTIRIQWPPFEKKIVSAKPNGRKGLGDFLLQLAGAEKFDVNFANNNAKNFNKVRGLLEQAKECNPFQKCREGNEVLVDCSSGKAELIDAIAKSTENSPVNRKYLVEIGMVSEDNHHLGLNKSGFFQKNLPTDDDNKFIDDTKNTLDFLDPFK
ncbi:MAG: hypothetical protein HYX60_00190 [Legionella longbeachae]|nr:hypothetical protein [Legionella longbeachae]